jgi:hypothetical protein
MILMPGEGFMSVMNTTINNNRKLLKKQARDKMGYSGIYANTEPTRYSFDDVKYDENAKNKINHVIAKRKKEAYRRKLIGVMVSIFFVIIVYVIFKFHQKSMA